MIPDFSGLQPFVNALPAPIAVIANVAIFCFAMWALVANARVGKRIAQNEREQTEEHARDDAREDASIPSHKLLERFVMASETQAANAILQTEALKTIAAAQTIAAQAMEDDFDELRIFKAVHEALDAQAEKRRREQEEREAREDDRRTRTRQTRDRERSRDTLL